MSKELIELHRILSDKKKNACAGDGYAIEASFEVSIEYPFYRSKANVQWIIQRRIEDQIFLQRLKEQQAEDEKIKILNKPDSRQKLDTFMLKRDLKFFQWEIQHYQEEILRTEKLVEERKLALAVNERAEHE